MKKLIIGLMVAALVLTNLYIFYPAFTVEMVDDAARYFDLIFNPRHAQEKMTSSAVQTAEPEDDGIFIIVIDPGHGGRDPGAISADGTLRESSINLEIARQLADALNEYEGISVYLTHEETEPSTDPPELFERVQFAFDMKADLLISIHNNANFADYSGCEIYVSGRVDSPSAQSSAQLAHLMLEHLGELGMRRRGVFYRLSQAGWTDDLGRTNDYYGIIRMAEDKGMPAMLVENAFLNDIDARFVCDEESIKKIAQAHAAAILEYLGIKSREPEENYDYIEGDANGDGQITIEDRLFAQAAAMCHPDAPVLEQYVRADVNSSGLVDAFDLYAIREMSRNGGMLPSCSDTKERAECLISSDTAAYLHGDIVTVWVQVGSWHDILSAVGTVDYNTEVFDFIGVEDECDGLITIEDSNFGLVRFCYLPAGQSQGAAAFALRFRMHGEPDGEALSFNLNCYSSIYALEGEIYTMMPNCAQTVMSVSE